MTEKHLIYLEDALAVMPALEMCTRALKKLPTVEAKPVVYTQWQKQWCDSSMIGHMYEECPICGCTILDTEKFWDCKFCPNCGTEMR